MLVDSILVDIPKTTLGDNGFIGSINDISLGEFIENIDVNSIGSGEFILGGLYVVGNGGGSVGQFVCEGDKGVVLNIHIFYL